VRRCLENTLAVLAEAGAGAEHVVRMTWFITDREEYLANLEGMGQVYRELMGRHFPAMTMVEVPALIESEAKVEVETTAVVPSDPRRAVEAGLRWVSGPPAPSRSQVPSLRLRT
jgi:enamine deaminase RidA (YjgF/YER057c/UK114 family)